LQLELHEAFHQYQLEKGIEMQKWNNQQTADYFYDFSF
jgi:hypothetical protein